MPDRVPSSTEINLSMIADRVWPELDAADWLEALEGHPRIGENGGSSKAHSAAEQAQVTNADQRVRAAIAAGNQACQARFGHVFLIFRTGVAARRRSLATRRPGCATTRTPRSGSPHRSTRASLHGVSSERWVDRSPAPQPLCPGRASPACMLGAARDPGQKSMRRIA